MEQRNYSVMMGDILIASVMIILANLLTDIVYGWADPRIRTS
jgi:peptide/nickel transport system permease protein